jgi:hypothetical protein
MVGRLGANGSYEAFSSMHIMLAWDITAKDDRAKAISGEMKSALDGFSWVRVLRNVFILKIDAVEDRDNLHEKLKRVASEVGEDEKVNFIISPALEGGRYQGWLPKRLWPKINARIGE